MQKFKDLISRTVSRLGKSQLCGPRGYKILGVNNLVLNSSRDALGGATIAGVDISLEELFETIGPQVIAELDRLNLKADERDIESLKQRDEWLKEQEAIKATALEGWK